MKRKRFDGIAVHPAKVAPGTTTMVGVWLGLKVSQSQRQDLKRLNNNYRPGHIGVRTSDKGTVVMYLGCSVTNAKAARKIATSLVQSVRTIVGATAILRQLRDYREVSRALAG